MPGSRVPLTIDRLGAQGDGVAETADGPLYVPFTVPGDVVEVERTPARRGAASRQARLGALVHPGPGRRSPPCPHFGICGGCALQHLDAALYEEWATMRIRTALGHHGFEEVPLAAPFVERPGTRRRLVLKARSGERRIALGFQRRRSHRLVDIETCPVARPALVALLDPLRDLCAQILPPRGMAEVTLTESMSGIDCLIAADVSLDLARREALGAFAARHDLAALHCSEQGSLETVVQRRPPVMDFDGIAVPLPPGAFVQATAAGEAALRSAVQDWTAGTRRVADLFSGIGTFALPLARRAAVLAVEGAKPLLDALAEGARRAAGLKRVDVEHRDLFRRPLLPDELAVFDAVVFDPPRAGAMAQAQALAQSEVPAVIAVSCNPNTFARDARILVDGGYRLAAVRLVDQFLWSGQMELAALFRR